MTVKDQIVSKAVELLEMEPAGIRFSVLVKKLQAELPNLKPKGIPGVLVKLQDYANQQIYKPAKGLFLHLKYKPAGEIPQPPQSTPKTADKITEQDFYSPFADYLVGELQECTKAIPLGGNKFKDKWGTPDVIGIRRPRDYDIIKFDIEIVSAEIKIDSNGLITAFGQACSYKLFSHKSYIVVPADSSQDDRDRLEALCQIFGIGLILFNRYQVSAPDFEIRVRATLSVPDTFYVNKNLDEVKDQLFT